MKKVGLDDPGPAVGLLGKTSGLKFARAGDMIDVDLELANQFRDIRDAQDDGNSHLLDFGHPHAPAQATADNHVETRLIQMLRKQLDGLFCPAKIQNVGG